MAALAPELLVLRDTVLPMVGMTNIGNVNTRQTSQFLALHGFTSIDDFNRVEPHQAKELVKACNTRHPAQSMGVLVMNNLTGLIWHVKDMTCRGLPLDLNAIDPDTLYDGHLAYEAYVQNRDKGDNIKSLEKWSDKFDFDDWDRKVSETLSLIYGRNYCPLAYVIRPDKPAGWDPLVDATNDYERLMYQLPLAGTAYNRDNETVFSYIQLAVVQTAAETWIYDAVPGRDGRAAMRALRGHYEGEAELDVQANRAREILNDLVYTNERTMAFEAMITKLNKAYNSLKRQGQEYTDKSKVEHLAKRIKNPTKNIEITVAVETMREKHKNDYNAATQFISGRMAQINGASINAPGQNARRISEAEANRTEFNGVNIQNPWRQFTDDEWFNKLGQRGREIVEAKRRAGNDTRNQAGRGGGRGRGRGRGYGRGGRTGGRTGGRNGGRGGQNNQNNSNGDRSVNEASSGDRNSVPTQIVASSATSSRAREILNDLVYTNERTMAFEAMITKLNKAYNSLKRQGQEYTDKSKVEHLAKRIKNPTKNIEITVAVETMREKHKNDYNAATQFISGRMAQINGASINAPGQNARRISEAEANRTEFNGVNIQNPWRQFTDDEWFNKLGQRGREIVEAKRRAGNDTRNQAGRGGGRGRGRGRGYGRGGRTGGRTGGRNGGRGGQNNQNNSNGDRSVNEASSGDRNSVPTQIVASSATSSGSLSASSQNQASTGERGGQNGSRFGSNRA